jgi:Asp-tRNA(Asn)/Glu-tRNA(Gln) amidotransferase B subunit
LKFFRQENERLLSIRREDERLELEEEENIRSKILNILSEKEFNRQINIEDEVKKIKIESRSWINSKDLTREIERILNEKHDYNYSIDLSGIKRTQIGKEIIEQDKPNLVSISPFDLEQKNLSRKPPGASKYEE